MAVKNKIFLPTLISSITYQPVRTLPHIYFYNGLKDCEDYYIQHYPTGSTAFVETSVQNKFPYLDYYDGLEPTTGSNSLLFFNETPPYGVTPTGSLYTQYWDKYVSLLYNPRTRLIKASAIIPLADYFEMELNDIVQWRGNYYHLRAINDYNLKDGTCKLELLGPIIRDAAPTEVFDCTFNFSSSFAGVVPGTTTTLAPTTTTTLSPTTSTTLSPTTTIAPTTTVPPTTSTTTLETYTIEYLMVAGGGGGSSRHAGGGGAGGFISGSRSVVLTDTFPIVVGAGGTGTTGLGIGTNGNDTTFNFLTAVGGGTGGGFNTNNGASGGSGGGALGVNSALGGVGTGAQGTNGGNGISYAGGGGGGALTLGINGTITTPGGNIQSNGGAGGSGKLWLDGVRYAGGGGGAPMGSPFSTFNTEGIGGAGGGGTSGKGVAGLENGFSGAANTGGGGGAGAGRSTVAGNGAQGGSGIVIIRYLGSQRGLGGTVTEAGGYTYHTFTSSGTYSSSGFVGPTTTTTTVPPTTTTQGPTTSTTTLVPTTTTTIAFNTFTNSGYGNTVNGSCSDASINNRTLYSDCSSINVGCTIYTTTGGTPLTGYTFVFIDGAVWNINSSTGVITSYSSIQC